MDDETVFRIGDNTYVAPALTLYALEAAWPDITSLGQATSMMEQSKKMLRIAVCALELNSPQPDFIQHASMESEPAPVTKNDLRDACVEYLSKKLRINQFKMLDDAIAALLKASGLGADPGDPASGEAMPTGGQ